MNCATHHRHCADPFRCATVVETTPGSSYDYQAQQWRDSHDHTHSTPQGPAFCGADLATCQGKTDTTR